MAAPAPAPVKPPSRRADDGLSTAHKPYVPDEAKMAEFTWSAVIAGALLGIVFGASSLYLVLKVGMTVSASIPVAVLSITLFRGLSRAFGFRPATILENNIVQTAGSAGESIAFGVGVTMPAIMLLGFDMTLPRVMIVSLLGGVLGILMMIPLRRAFIVRMHGQLLYPEGTACAQVLMTGDKGGASGQLVFLGFFIAFCHKFLTGAAMVLQETIHYFWGKFNRAAVLSMDLAPELLGVGFIIGVKTASIMMAGAVVGNLVILPAIALFGDSVPGLISPGAERIADMDFGEIQASYLRYIGAGCVTAAGIISMFRTLPMIVRSATAGLRGLGGSQDSQRKSRRTEHDMPLPVVVVGSLILLGVLAAILSVEVPITAALLGAGLVLAFGFLFVTVSSRLTGEIGSSSNPISGMTVATLSLTCLIFLSFGMTTPSDRVLALSIAGVVCIAASNAGTTSQDLKTGYLIGGTPILQQYAILVGALTSALVIGGTLLLFNQAGVVYSEINLPKVVLTPSQFDALNEKESYQGKEYRVWQPTAQQFPGVPAAKYLVGEDRQPAWIVDPGITGRIPERETFLTDQLPTGRYRDRLNRENQKKPLPSVTLRGGQYFIWDVTKESDPDVSPGRYLVDGNGVVRYRVESSEVKMKFAAPKTQVMGIIINGVLEQTLNWGLVLIGAMLAIGIELCGASSLAFAVGVYIPMQYTSPIFLGGVISWLAGKIRGRKNQNKSVVTEAESESSPGTLLASGYIAGGTLAAVVIAFIEFSPALKKALNYKESVPDAVRGSLLPVAIFAVLIVLLFFIGSQRTKDSVSRSPTSNRPE
ncbi:MAG: oligopeptide transporter, OPT family [Pirellulales bacterium]|nr:oligopeptide transporter, OPT family [Pirellulales bacterium]